MAPLDIHMTKWKHRSRFWLGLGISVVFLYLALHNVEWADVYSAWREARAISLAAGVLLLVACWGVGAVRWRVLLAPTPDLRVRDTFAYITIGYLANTVLPLRLGDLARATLIGRNKGLGVSRSLGSMAIERVLDLLTLIGLTLLLMLLIRMPAVVQAGLTTAAALALVALVFLMILAFNERRWPGLTALPARVMPHRVAERIMRLVANFSSGASVIRRPTRFAGVLGLSVLLWTVAGMAMLAWVHAFRLEVPWYAGFFLLVVINLGSAIPSSPGYIGVYHYLAVLALSVWIPDRSPALAFAIGTHALNMLTNVTLGAWFLSREGISLRSLKTEAGGI